MEREISWKPGAIAQAIEAFLTEKGVMIAPETASEFETQISQKLQDKKKTQPEFEMCLIESIMPFFPTATAQIRSGLRSVSSLTSSFLEAAHELVLAARNNEGKEKVKQSLLKIEDLIKSGKLRLEKNVNDLKAKSNEAIQLKQEAQAILQRFYTDQLVSEIAREKFPTLQSLVEAKSTFDGGDSSEDEEDAPNAKAPGKGSTRRAFAAEREARQRLALDYYMKNFEISMLRSAMVATLGVYKVFDKISQVDVERGTQHFNVLSDAFLHDFIFNKLGSATEELESEQEDIEHLMDSLSKVHQYTTYTKEEGSAAGIPPYKLAELLPDSDYATKNWIKLLSLDEIYQNHLQSKGVQKSKISPDKDKISMDDFSKSYGDNVKLTEFLDPEDMSRMKQFFDIINKGDEMTWKRGMSVSLFSDPPVPHTLSHMTEETLERGDFTTQKQTGTPGKVEMNPEALTIQKRKLQDRIKDLGKRKKRYPNSPKIQEWDNEISSAKTQLQEIGTQLADTQKTYSQSGATVGRKLFEASRPNAHWATLLSAVRPSIIEGKAFEEDMRVKQQAVSEIDSLAESVAKSKKEKGTKQSILNQLNKSKAAIENIFSDPGQTKLLPKEVVVTAIENPNVPYWVLMRAVQFPYDKSTRDLALYNLEHTRGWVPVLGEDGKPAVDAEGDMLWQKNKKSEKKGSNMRVSQREVKAQDMSRNLDQQLKAVQDTVKSTEEMKKALEEEKRMKQMAPQQPVANPANAPTGTPAAMGVNPAGVKTFASKKVSSRG